MMESSRNHSLLFFSHSVLFERRRRRRSGERGAPPLTMSSHASRDRAASAVAFAAALAAASQADVEAVIRSTGFFRAKARNIRGCCEALMERHGGEVPRTLEELVRLPGVGRKTANVVLGSGFGVPSGVVVDTHVGRISRRLGLTRHADAVKAERDLIAAIPKSHWIAFSHRLIEHGRTVCTARRPRCENCPLADLCPCVGVKPATKKR